jgi:hypothetical protein
MAGYGVPDMIGNDDGRVPDREKNNFRPGMRESDFPTGRVLALALAKRFPGQDWIALVVGHSDRRRDEVEWHLQEDMVPPDDIRQACETMLKP